MCTQQTTELVYALQERANEDMIIQQREATIKAALALPEAERMRLWMELGKEFAPELDFDFAPVYPESDWPQPEGTSYSKWIAQGYGSAADKR